MKRIFWSSSVALLCILVGLTLLLLGNSSNDPSFTGAGLNFIVLALVLYIVTLLLKQRR